MRGAGRGGLLWTVFAPEDGFEGRGGLEEEVLLEGVCPLLGLLGPVAMLVRQCLRAPPAPCRIICTVTVIMFVVCLAAEYQAEV